MQSAKTPQFSRHYGIAIYPHTASVMAQKLYRIWYCWMHRYPNTSVKLTDTTDCIPPDVNLALQLFFQDTVALQDFINTLRVSGFAVDATDLEEYKVK